SNLRWQRRQGDVGEPVLDDVVWAESRTRRLLPPQRTLADRADEAAHPVDVRRVQVVGHPVGLVTADVDVRAREDRRNAGQHLLDQLEGRGQLWVEPRGVVFVTGWQLEFDQVATGVQLRVHPHDRGRVAGCVDLGNDRDESVRGVGGERTEVFGAV